MSNQNYELSLELFTQVIDGETILLDGVTEAYFALNPTATIFWETLKKHDNLNDVYSELVDLYDVEERRLKDDLKNFTDQLIAKEFIRFNEK